MKLIRATKPINRSHHVWDANESNHSIGDQIVIDRKLCQVVGFEFNEAENEWYLKVGESNDIFYIQDLEASNE